MDPNDRKKFTLGITRKKKSGTEYYNYRTNVGKRVNVSEKTVIEKVMETIKKDIILKVINSGFDTVKGDPGEYDY